MAGKVRTVRDIIDYTAKYLKEPFESEMVIIRKNIVLEQCMKYKHANILEIGCGLSPFFVMGGENNIRYSRMVIVEPSVEFAENAERLSNGSSSIQVINGFLEDKCEEIKKMNIDFDFIICSALMHEIENPRLMLDSISKLCSRDTVVHINVPNAKSIHRLVAKETGMISDIYEMGETGKELQRHRMYDMDSLILEMNNAGYRVIDKGSYFMKPLTQFQLQKCLDEGIVDEKVIEGFCKVVRYIPEYGAELYVNASKIDNIKSCGQRSISKI